jgi:hypothetical protein
MTKYVLANVQLPIRVNENGSIETLQPYAQIHVIKEIQSPDEVEHNSLSLQEQIHILFQNINQKQEIENQPNNKEENIPETPVLEHSLFVLKEEIISGSRTSLKNTSFKNRKHYRNNMTARKYT